MLQTSGSCELRPLVLSRVAASVRCQRPVRQPQIRPGTAGYEEGLAAGGDVGKEAGRSKGSAAGSSAVEQQVAAEHPRLAEDIARLDIFLVATQELVNSELRQAILSETRRLAEQLAPRLERFIRRVAAVRLDYDPEHGAEGRSVEQVFSFPPP